MEPLNRNDDPLFRATIALDRGFLKSKKGGKLQIHCNGDLSNAELLFRTMIYVSQLSVFGAIADWCGELAQQISDHAFSSTGKPVAQNEELDCGHCFVTIHDLDDGRGGGAGACREHTLETMKILFW